MDKYSLSHLSGMPESRLRDILRTKFGLSDDRLKSKKKIQLIEMVCDQQDAAESAPSMYGPTKPPSGRINITDAQTYLNSDLQPGDVCHLLIANAAIFEDAVFVGPLRPVSQKRRKQIVGLIFNVLGQDFKLTWDKIGECWKI